MISFSHNYADEKMPYTYGENIESVIKSLEQGANLIFNLSKNNQVKGSEGKSDLLLSTDKTVK